MRYLIAVSCLFAFWSGAVEAFVVPQLSPVVQHTISRGHDSSSPLQKIIHLGNANHCPQASSTALFGIPKMFRWLTDQYPNINSRLSEGLSSEKVVDNFYLDMNGIIHPCTHGNSDELVILDETAMFKKIFGYVDRLVLIHVVIDIYKFQIKIIYVYVTHRNHNFHYTHTHILSLSQDYIKL